MLFALTNSAEILLRSRLVSQARQIESLLSDAITSANNQNSTLQLYISKSRLQLFRDKQLLDQVIIPPAYSFKKQTAADSDSSLENVYPSGAQSPFTLRLSNSKNFCLITVSLRGRVNRKCFFT